MFAVIFTAEIEEIDQEYSHVAKRMRELAVNEYGCIDFNSVTEGNKEIAISYWPNLDSVTAWKNNPEHKQAQMIGKSKWYKSYTVQVVEIMREYNG